MGSTASGQDVQRLDSTVRNLDPLDPWLSFPDSH
jgi:hypothetical protein